jgi:CheY-like chemotaxis protein
VTVILHVEDEPSDRLIVSLAFQKAAPSVKLHAVVNGDEAISYLSGLGIYANRELHPMPHLVLLDLKLPRRSGLEVLEWIRSRPESASLPVFMMTSSQEPSDLERAYALGVNSYLVKSVDLKEMRELVKGIGEYVRLLVPPQEQVKAPRS